jgi:hypothetical protein
MSFLQAFFAGVFLVNGVPHFIKGIMGQTHMTPFKRVSDAYTNVFWGFSNFLLGLLILGMEPVTGAIHVPTGMNFWFFLIGAFVMSLMDASLFSKPNARLPWHKD